MTPGDVARIEEYLDVYLKTGIGFTVDRSLIALGAALAAPVAESVGEKRGLREEVVLRSGLGESKGLRAGEAAVVRAELPQPQRHPRVSAHLGRGPDVLERTACRRPQVVRVHDNATVDVERQSDGRALSGEKREPPPTLPRMCAASFRPPYLLGCRRRPLQAWRWATWRRPRTR